MIRRVSACCLFLLLNGVLAAGQNLASNHKLLVKDTAFRSASLQREMHYRIVLPEDYRNGGRFPVLYLLHGIFGDYKNWDNRTHLEDYAKDMGIIIAMPDADDSWYSNSATVPTDKFEDYIIKDLIPEIDGNFRTIRDRHARAIAGLSMGGYGAVKLGLKYPELFVFSGSLSGAFNATQNLDALRPEFRIKLLEVFSSEGSSTRTENDVFTLLNARHEIPYPYFYLACGTSDFFLDTNRAFAQQLSSRNLPYEYHETAGGHTWAYWDGAVKPLLQAVDRALETGRAATNKDRANKNTH
ncbi:MAG: alpha/beta hydrolase [Terriglobales bacterium]